MTEIRASELMEKIASMESFCANDNNNTIAKIICANTLLTSQEKQILREYGAKFHVGQVMTQCIFPSDVILVNDIPNPNISPEDAE